MNGRITDSSTRSPGLRGALARIPGLRDFKRAVFRTFSSPDARLVQEAYNVGMTQHRSEIMSLVGLVRRLRPARVLEIGTSAGGTLYLWTHLTSEAGTLISVDLPHTWSFDDPKERANLELFRGFAGKRQTLHLLRKDSHLPQTRNEVSSLLGSSPVDFLFIDGDHSYEGVRKEFNDYGAFVRPGGMIAFHDIIPQSQGLGGDVSRFWSEVRDRYHGTEFVDNRAQDGFGIGVIRVGSVI